MEDRWLYNGRYIDKLEDLGLDYEPLGFVYRITNFPSRKIYVGKKNFFTRRKKNLKKSEISSDKRKKTYKHVVAESDWKEYWSSSLELIADVEKFGKSNFDREILEICTTSKELSYFEMKYMFILEVMERDTYNGNVAGKFYRKDLIHRL